LREFGLSPRQKRQLDDSIDWARRRIVAGSAADSLSRRLALSVQWTDEGSAIIKPCYPEILARNALRFPVVLQGLLAAEGARKLPGLDEHGRIGFHISHHVIESFVRHCEYGPIRNTAERCPDGFLPPIEFLMHDPLRGDCDTKTLLYAGLVGQLAMESGIVDTLGVQFVQFWNGRKERPYFHFCVAFDEQLTEFLGRDVREEVNYPGYIVIDVSCCDDNPSTRRNRQRIFRYLWNGALRRKGSGKKIKTCDRRDVPAFQTWEMTIYREAGDRVGIRIRG
jgi:hypothetical protein